jgi:hypothetical protein
VVGVLPIITVLRGFLISRSVRLDNFLIERCRGHPRSRTAVVDSGGDERASWRVGRQPEKSRRSARELLAVPEEGDAADLGWFRDGVLVRIIVLSHREFLIIFNKF